MKPKFYFLAFILMYLASGFVFSQDNKGAYNQIYGTNELTGNDIPKFALVIGIADYQHINKLSSPVLDARAMRDKLTSLGVVVYYYENLSKTEMENVIRDFEKILTPDCWAIFYYSGHASEYADPFSQTATNYLLPKEIERNIPRNEYKEKAISADIIIDKMSEKVINGPKFIILDACRDNPFKSGGGKGLSAMSTRGNSLIAFAASPGDVALDGGTGQLSPYTAELVEKLNTPNKALHEIIFDVQIQIAESTRKEQKPWINNGLEGHYYLNPAPTDPNTATLIVTSPQAGYLSVGHIISENIKPNTTNTYKIPKGSFSLKFEYLDSDATFNQTLDMEGGATKRVTIPVDEEPKPDTPVNVLLPKMIFVEGGTFRMGCTKSNHVYPCENNQKKVHFVSLGSFRISKTEITNRQYCDFLNDHLDKTDQFDKWIDIGSQYLKVKFLREKF
ncbi:MAG: caspase family protein, partial [Bacteroidales bacterium]|nr:caspase family protein [Bacteroidales bacterium]